MRQITFERKPDVFGIKSPTLWITSRNNPSAIYPIAYIRKPKNVDQDEFDAFIGALSFRVNSEFLTPQSTDKKGDE